MRTSVAIDVLTRLKSEAFNIDALYHDAGATESWKCRVRAVIARSLGDGHDLVGKLDRNSYELGVWTDRTTSSSSTGRLEENPLPPPPGTLRRPLRMVCASASLSAPEDEQLTT